jgi:hypothetical protein
VSGSEGEYGHCRSTDGGRSGAAVGNGGYASSSCLRSGDGNGKMEMTDVEGDSGGVATTGW